MAMITNRRREVAVAMTLIAPFVLTFVLVFLYPTIRMIELSFTNAPLIGPGNGSALPISNGCLPTTSSIHL